ncbi:hypothetical protein BVRB_027300, partial [Beta vulgaris subsp. vulgaris]
DGIFGVDIREAAAQMQREEIERCKGMPLEQHPKVQRILQEELGNDSASTGYSHVARLSLSNLAMRGTRLAYTGAAIGVVVYAGHDCKVVKNWRSASRQPKRSHLMKQLDWAMALILGVRLLFALFSATGNSLFARGTSLVASEIVVQDLGLSGHHHWIDIDMDYIGALYDFARRLSILRKKLWEQTSNLLNKPAMMTSNVNADLGQVEYVFTEKLGLLSTGTIRVATINCDGIEYDAEGPAVIQDLWN